MLLSAACTNRFARNLRFIENTLKHIREQDQKICYDDVPDLSRPEKTLQDVLNILIERSQASKMGA